MICFWLLDAGNNTSMEPYRAFISDRLPKSQLARGFLTQSMFTGAGAVLANLSLFVLQKVSALEKTAGNGVPYWMYVCFMIGTVCILVTVLTAMARTKELTPSDEELEEMRSAPKGLGARSSTTSGTPSRRCRSPCTRSVWSSSSSGTRCSSTGSSWRSASVRRCSTPRPSRGVRPGTSAIAWSGLQNAAYNFVTMVSALFLVGFAQRIGAKRVHAIALGLAAVALIWLAHIHNQYLALVPMIGLGIFWASAVGVPYLMVASMVPAKRTGVYMGILNMMIVVPMLIETVTFGWIFNHLLDSKGCNAIILAGVLMAIGAVAMLWVNPPDEADESPIVPLGGQRSITVYDRVVVGSDGTPTSLYAVDRAAEVAQAAQARLVVVTAYREGDPSAAPSPAEGMHRDRLRRRGGSRRPWRSRSPVSPRSGRDTSSSGSSAATRRRRCSTRSARTRRTSSSSATVGWARARGSCLGSVPREVVKNAVCDVLIVQTSALDEDRIFARAAGRGCRRRWRSGHGRGPGRLITSSVRFVLG